MTVTKLIAATLVLGASLTPALAETEAGFQTPLAAYEQSLGKTAAAPAVIEGRQSAPIVAPAAPASSAERYLGSRERDQDR